MRRSNFFICFLLAAPLLVGMHMIEFGRLFESYIQSFSSEYIRLLINKDSLIIALSFSMLLTGGFIIYLIKENRKGDVFNHELRLMNKKFQAEECWKDKV